MEIRPPDGPDLCAWAEPLPDAEVGLEPCKVAKLFAVSRLH